MSTYKNLFTRVQIHTTEPYPGAPMQPGSWPRSRLMGMNHLLGWIGDAQLGPIYLGWTGMASLLCGFIAIEIIGLNMMASVHWNPVQFIRQFCYIHMFLLFRCLVFGSLLYTQLNFSLTKEKF